MMRFYTDDPFRFVEADGVTWCYNPEEGTFLNMNTNEIVKESEVPEAVRKRLLSYTDDDEFEDRIERIIRVTVGNLR